MFKAKILAAIVFGLGLGASSALAVAAPLPCPIKIAVFPFELEDFSAARQAGSAPDETKYLADSTEEAKHLLLQSGHYLPVDTSNANKRHDLRDCKGCEAVIAAKLAADQSLIGVVTKISMTEYTIRIEVRNARNGAMAADLFTDLRIGADYSWPRGVRWLIENRMLQTNEHIRPASQ
jgi:hypothetical protein